MTQNIFLATRSAALGTRTINGIRACAINMVSTSTSAQVIAAAVAKLNGGTVTAPSGESSNFDAKYFDTVVQLDDVTSGPLNANLRTMIFADRVDPPLVAA